MQEELIGNFRPHQRVLLRSAGNNVGTNCVQTEFEKTHEDHSKNVLYSHNGGSFYGLAVEVLANFMSFLS